jgi:hypothetical protein
MGHGRYGIQERFDLRFLGRDAAVRLEDDSGRFAGLRRESILEQVERFLRIGARDRKVVVELTLEAERDCAEDDQEGDPAAEHFPAIADREAAPPVERARFETGSWSTGHHDSFGQTKRTAR